MCLTCQTVKLNYGKVDLHQLPSLLFLFYIYINPVFFPLSNNLKFWIRMLTIRTSQHLICVDFLNVSFTSLSNIFLSAEVCEQLFWHICNCGHVNSKFVELLVLSFVYFFFCGKALVWFSGYARNLPLQVWRTVKDAQESFSFSPSSAVTPLRLYNALVVLSCFSIKHFVEFSLLRHNLFHLFTCPHTSTI